MCGTAVYYSSGVSFVLFHIALVLRVFKVWCRYLAHKAWRPSRAISGFARNFGIRKLQCFRVVNWAFRKIAESVELVPHGSHLFPRATVSYPAPTGGLQRWIYHRIRE